MGGNGGCRRVRLLLGVFVYFVVFLAGLGGVASASSAGSAPSFLRDVGGVLFFATYRDPGGGWQLWTSDGTPGGTVLLRDGLGLDIELVALDDRLVFSTRGGLWTSDGTPGGTILVKALPFYPNGIKSVRRGVYFSDGRGQLWKSDLTDAGTTLVRDIPPGFVFHDLTPAAITSTGDGVFFRAVDAAIGTELWRSDGTADGTMPVIDLNPIGGSAPGEFLNVRGTLYFSATDGQRGYELWRSDGTAAGTVLVKDINPTGDAWPMLLRLVGDTFYFSADDGTGPELWKSDGTEAGTVKVADLNPDGGSYPNALLAIGATLYFRADDGKTGVELWKTDGTAEGTTQVADVNPTGSSVPANLRNVNGRLFFTADDGVHGEELWRSDGTAAGTVLVVDLNPAGGSYPHYVVNADGTLFFAADDGSGTQLWTLHGCGSAAESCAIVRLPLPDQPPSSSGVPYLVKDLNPGPGDGAPYDMTDVGGTAFFQAYRPDTGVELWASDGTEAGTRLVRDLNPGPDGSSPYDFTDLGGVAFFVATTTGGGAAVWKSDGTEGGTEIVQAFASAWQASAPHDLTVAGGKVWFVAPGDGGNEQIWSTDGGAGAPAAHALPGMAAVQRGYARGAGRHAVLHRLRLRLGKQALWKTDGTPGGNVEASRGFRGFATAAVRVGRVPALFPRQEQRALAHGRHRRGDRDAHGLGKSRRAHRARRSPVLRGLGLRSRPRAVAFRRDAARHLAREGHRSRSGGRHAGTPDERRRHALLLGGRRHHGLRAVEERRHPRRHRPGARHRSHRRHRAVVLPGGRRPALLHRTDPELRLRAVAQRRHVRRDRLVRDINLTRSSYPESPANVGGVLFFNADDGRLGEELWAVPAASTTTTSTVSTTTATSSTTTSLAVPQTTTTSSVVPTTAPGTTSTSTTTSPSSTTSSSTQPAETCGNCIDDDHDGLVDLEDPACCAATGTMQLGHARVASRRGGLVLSASLRGMDLGVLRGGTRDVVLQLRSADGSSFCARIPGASLHARKRALHFKDPRQLTGSAGGVTRLRLAAGSNGAVSLTAGGPSAHLVSGSGPVSLRIGFVSPAPGDGHSACAAATVPASGRGRGDQR